MTEDSYHYGIIRRAIDVIDAQDGAPLPLDELARQMDMSPAHFQRVFSSFAGVSPKRFQQYLTLGHAKTMLRDRFTTLETADAVGLSGTGRLHDLFIKWEAMSPGEYARKGRGMTISYGWFDGPFGDTLTMGTERGICGMAFAAESTREATFSDMSARWPNATFIENADLLREWTGNAFGGTGDTQLFLIGAPLQIKVWEALLSIPTGHVSTYSELAIAANAPRAVRAVGTAVGRNPISWLIPCHRALRKSGELGGYHWGLPVKRAMLAYESALTDMEPSTDGRKPAAQMGLGLRQTDGTPV